MVFKGLDGRNDSYTIVKIFNIEVVINAHAKHVMSLTSSSIPPEILTELRSFPNLLELELDVGCVAFGG